MSGRDLSWLPTGTPETYLNVSHMVRNRSWMQEVNYQTHNPTVHLFLQMMKTPTKLDLMKRTTQQDSLRIAKRQEMRQKFNPDKNLGQCYHCHNRYCLSLDPEYMRLSTVEATELIYQRLKEHKDTGNACWVLLNCPHEASQNHRLLYHHPLYTPNELRQYRRALAQELKTRRPVLITDEEEEEDQNWGMVMDDLHGRPMMLEKIDLLEYEELLLDHPRSVSLSSSLASPRDQLRQRKSTPFLMTRSSLTRTPHPCAAEPRQLAAQRALMLEDPSSLPRQ